jgi:hypothetical protein
MDYKEKRQSQLEKEQQNRDDLSDSHVRRSYRTPTDINNKTINTTNSTTNHFNSHSVLSGSSIHNKYQSPNQTDRS